MSRSFKTACRRLLQTDTMQMLLMVATLAQATDVAALSWLSGCWRQESPSRTVDETWMAPAGDGMLGMSRTVANGRIVEHEFLQIRVQDRRLVYIAKPSGQPEATFTAIKMGSREVVFENPAHDFPQRIIYRLQADRSLSARIEGTRNGQASTTQCDASVARSSWPVVRGLSFPVPRRTTNYG
jgi:hypothetical protein